MVKTPLRWLLVFFGLCTLGHFTTHAADCDHSRGRTDNEFIPDAKLKLAPISTEHFAMSFLGEVGRRNYRINGTLGFLLNETNYFKFSSEYLTQKLGYRFSSGKTEQWRHQTAFGAAYQKQLRRTWIDNTELQGFYSFAPSRDLHRESCPETCNFLRRHIAGSHAGGGLLGATFIPWKTGLLQIRANYDYVSYDRKYKHKAHDSGFGGTVNWFQKLGCYVDFALKAELRHPFHFFEGLINWHAPKGWRGFTLGLFGSHTQGKSHHLPNNNVAGIQLSYLIGFRKEAQDGVPVTQRTKTCIHPGTLFNSALVSWTSTPAVYLPEVLAVADQRRTKGSCDVCIAPTSVPVPDQDTTSVTFDVSPFFTDPTGTHPLTYSLDPFSMPFTIDPSTGVVSTNGASGFNIITVTATNECGTTSQDVVVLTPG